MGKGDSERGLAADSVVAERYRLVRELGRGGMGVVWEAVDTARDERVALKLLHGFAADRPDMKARFLREARATMRIDHPNVVRTREIASTEDGAPALVMDLLVGESLAQRLARVKAFEVHAFADLFLQVLSAVGHAHSIGLVHRDLKPDNIFLVRASGGSGEGRTDEVRVLDFGLAKWLDIDVALAQTRAADTAEAALTATGALLGTPYYMSPEQVFGEKDLDHRSDIWSLGVILYECLAGRRPLDGENVGQIIKAITSGAIAPLAEAAPHVPAPIAELARRMLSVDRAARPADLREVQEALRAHADVRVPDIAPVARSLAQHSGALRKPRRWAIVAFGAFGALGALGGIAALGIARGVGARPDALAAHAPPAPIASGASIASPPVSPAGPAAPEAARRSVRVAVSPASAAIEIDGAPAANANGVALVEGTLGSVHRVRITSGNREANADVAITEAGAVPARIEIAKRGAGAVGVSAASSGAAAARAPSAADPPGAKAPSPSAATSAPREPELNKVW